MSSGSAAKGNVAVVLLREPQLLSDEVLDGVAHTFVQLRSLGLVSTIIVDCGTQCDRNMFDEQSMRLCQAIDSYSKPGAKVLDEMFFNSSDSDSLTVDDRGLLVRALEQDLITIIPSLASPDSISGTQPADAASAIVALITYITGMQKSPVRTARNIEVPPTSIASVERIIVLDSIGATPMLGNSGVRHRFINLEQEFDGLIDQLKGKDGGMASTNHASNLALAKEALSVLPSSASALITSPYAAANTHLESAATAQKEAESSWEFDDMVTTRKKQNPLLYNLLTDKPLFSSSLPFQRVANGQQHTSPSNSTAATLVKVGLALSIYPDPRKAPWTPPKPGSTPQRLTDSCVDLPRLVHLIQDSFDRKLDVEDYLNRVKDNLAGIIIAGEYEGGAILTWEKPDHLTHQEAYKQGRYVPYLDKFAVLKCRQGSGGVADIVFNAMVRDCFPYGVCWRSRKNNPVNKWYFERSIGTSKLSDSNWAMFWTTPGLDMDGQKLKDYEAVCRSVQPSWADNKHVVD